MKNYEQKICGFRNHGALESVSERLKNHSPVHFDSDSANEILSYDIRLLFVITATCGDIRSKAREELGSLDILTNILCQNVDLSDSGKALALTSRDAKLVIDVMKVDFNLTMGLKNESISQVRQSLLHEE